MNQVDKPGEQQTPEALYVQFARALLGRLEHYQRTEGPCIRRVTFTQFSENGLYPAERWVQDYWSPFLRHLREIVGCLEPADRCVRCYLESGILDKPQLVDSPGNPIPERTDDQMGPVLYRDLMLPLLDVFAQNDTFNLTDEQLLECFRRFTNRNYRPTTAPTEIAIPLVNFTTDVTGEVIEGAPLLRPFTPEEKTSLWASSFPEMVFEGVIGPLTFLGARSKLVGWCDHRAGDRFEDSPVVVQSKRLLNALRLLKPGGVGAFAHFSTTEIGVLPNLLTDYLPRGSAKNTIYHLRASDLPGVKTVFDGLRAGAESVLAFPLRRFNQSYGRDLIEDRIVDLAISLEGCLVGGDKDEIAHKFALRGACLLSDSWLPKESHALLKALYDCRSKIAHEGRDIADKQVLKILSKHGAVFSPPLEPNEFPQRFEDIARDVLRAYVVQVAGRTPSSETIRQIANGLENAIVERL